MLKLPPRRQTTWSQQLAPTTTFGNTLGELCSIAGVTACSSSLRKCFVASCMTQAIYSGTAARTQRRGHTSKLHQCSVAVVMTQNRNRSNGIARAAYACSLEMRCGPVLGMQSLGIQSTITWSCKHHGHASIITWSFRARKKDKGTGAHNMGTCPLARLSPRG